jgi:hypothetical protein
VLIESMRGYFCITNVGAPYLTRFWPDVGHPLIRFIRSVVDPYEHVVN